jgi:molybdopterin synthase catalytic subunit
MAQRQTLIINELQAAQINPEELAKALTRDFECGYFMPYWGWVRVLVSNDVPVEHVRYQLAS